MADMSGLVTTLLHDPRVQGVLLTAVSNLIATEVNKRAKKPLSEEVRFWLTPIFLVMSAVTAGLNGLQNGDLEVDAANVNNFLTVLITSVTTHLGLREAGKANEALKAKKAAAKESQ
jgi:hypothetical protein